MTFDRQAVADALHGLHVSVKDNPGVLMDLAIDDKGDLDRESFLVEVVDGHQKVTRILPPLSAGFFSLSPRAWALIGRPTARRCRPRSFTPVPRTRRTCKPPPI